MAGIWKINTQPTTLLYISISSGSGLAYWSPGYPIEKYVPPWDGSQVRSFKSNSPILLLNEQKLLFAFHVDRQLTFSEGAKVPGLAYDTSDKPRNNATR